MQLLNRHVAAVTLSALLLFAGLSQADEPALDSLQGKWFRHVQTADGRVTIVKEHAGISTVLTAFDERRNVLYAHKSEFKTERCGRVSVFTFFNRTITAGPNAGQTDKEPASFVYRVAKDRFIEVHGVLEGDTQTPGMIVWERMVENAKDAT